MAYFYKEILSNEARLDSGRAASFEAIGDDNGILQTEDAGIIDSLRKLIIRRVGGVAEITKEQYDEYAKKKGGSTRYAPRLTDPPEYQALRQKQDQLRDVGDVAVEPVPHKRFGFSGAAANPPPEVAEKPAEPGVKPSAPKQDSPPPVRPTPKKVPPKTAGPEGNIFP